MKANELRIGNIILREGFEIEVTGWNISEAESSNTDLQPIPLTEEWLLKFGFKELKRFTHDFEEVIYGKSIIAGQDNHSEMLAISMPFKLAFIGEYLIDEDYVLNININYVHQLQNLYFALTDEELTLKS